MRTNAQRKILDEVTITFIRGTRRLRGGNVDQCLTGTGYSPSDRSGSDIRHPSGNVIASRNVGDSARSERRNLRLLRAT